MQQANSPRYKALLQLLRTAETLWKGSRLFFANWVICTSQFNILNLLSDQPAGLTQVELSRLLIMHRSNVTGLVDRLEKRGFIQRQDSPNDRRAYRVVLTTSGKKLIETILPEYYQAAEKIWEKFPVSRVKELTSDLSKLSENVEQFSEKFQSK
jgi:MarR family 2-MHQ and catechol resistance regulon transcriptional repressor